MILPSICHVVDIEKNRVLEVAASDVLTGVFKNTASDYFVIDLRNEEHMNCGSIPAEMNVEGRVWSKELMLEGVMRCLQEMKGKVPISANPDDLEENRHHALRSSRRQSSRRRRS